MPTLYVRDMDPDIWKEFKKKAIEEDMSASEAVRRLLKESLSFKRIECPKCGGVFWIEKKKEWSCPYCFITRRQK